MQHHRDSITICWKKEIKERMKELKEGRIEERKEEKREGRQEAGWALVSVIIQEARL